MLSLGLTGGIAAGKSLLADRFRELGAVLIDADRLAREAVAPGTPGLAQVVAHFGPHLLLPDGSLNRPQLGALVFAEPAAREALNAIVHPLVRAAANSLKSAAGPGTIVVQDIPLLVETGQGANFHLVVVVQAPLEARVVRMMEARGMSRADALARVAAQASDAERAVAADLVIANDGAPEQAVAALDALWHGRLLPFAANLVAGRAAREVPAPGHAGDAPELAEAGTARLLARIRRSVAELAAVEAQGEGSPSVVRVVPAAGVAPGQVLQALGGAGYFAINGSGSDAAGGDRAPVVLASADLGQDTKVLLVQPGATGR